MTKRGRASILMMMKEYDVTMYETAKYFQRYQFSNHLYLKSVQFLSKENMSLKVGSRITGKFVINEFHKQ